MLSSVGGLMKKKTGIDSHRKKFKKNKVFKERVKNKKNKPCKYGKYIGNLDPVGCLVNF